MKNRGFTLVELLAVIVVLAIILTIAVPSVLKIIKRSKIDSYQRQKELIVSATKTYVLTNEQIIPAPGETVTVSLQELIDAQLISEPVKDQRTNKVMDPITKVVSVTNTGDNKYTFEYIADWPNEVGYIYDEGKYSHMWEVVERDESTEATWFYANVLYGVGNSGYQSIEKDHILFSFDVTRSADSGSINKEILPVSYIDTGIKTNEHGGIIDLGRYNSLNIDYSFNLESMAGGGGGGGTIPGPSYPGTGLKIYRTTDVIDLEKYNNVNIEYSLGDGPKEQASGVLHNNMGDPVCYLYLAGLFGEKEDTGEITFYLTISPDLFEGTGLRVLIPEIEVLEATSTLGFKVYKIWFD